MAAAFVYGSYLEPDRGDVLIVLYAAWSWGFDRFLAEVNAGAGRVRVRAAWRPFMRYFIPAAVAIVTITGLGLFG